MPQENIKKFKLSFDKCFNPSNTNCGIARFITTTTEQYHWALI